MATAELAPGDTVQRLIDVHAQRTVELSVHATPASILTTDPVDGLHLTIERCTGNSWVRRNTKVRCASTAIALFTNVPLAAARSFAVRVDGHRSS